MSLEHIHADQSFRKLWNILSEWALVDRNFFTKDQAALEVGMGEEGEVACGHSMEELEGKVREALRAIRQHQDRMASVTGLSN